MEIVACPGTGSTDCIVVAPADYQKDIEKAKLSEERAKENSKSILIENSTESCVEVDAKHHKVIDDYNMESRIVVVGDVSCVLSINKVSDVDHEVGVDAKTNIELKESAENLEGLTDASEYVESGHKNGDGTDDYEQTESRDEYSRVIFPATFVYPGIEIEFGSLGKNTLIFPPAYVSPKLNIKFGSLGDNTNIELEDPNQETDQPPCGANNNNPEMIEDDKASDTQIEDATPRFRGEKLSGANTVVEDPSLVIETKCAATNNNNPQMIDINLLEDEKVICETLEGDKASDTQTEDAAQGFKDEKLNDTKTVVEDSSWVIEAKCAATSNNNNPDVILTNLQQHNGQGVGDVIQRVRDLVVINALKAVPSFEIERLNEQIKNARIQLDEKTRLRDAISDKVQKKKASLRAHNEGVNVANLKIRDAKQMVKSKRHEIDYVQRVIKNLKRAISAGEVDNKICEVRHSTDEKPVIHIIKQLNGIRDQVSSYMGSYDEIQQALHLEDRIQEVLKNLNKELETLKEDVSKSELVAKATSKRYKEDFVMEKLLRAQFIAAEAIRQQAYEHLHSLKTRLDDELEEFMDELKTNEELGMFATKKNDTTDGHPSQKVASKSVLVPDEIKSFSEVSTIETQRPISSVEEKHSDDQTKEKVAEENKQMMKTKEPANPTKMMDDQERDNIDESRKADELKKEETETKLKEQSQLDEIMKVEKTMEMNKRNAEKAQPPDAQRAQKEDEQLAQKDAMRKEKARLRRLRKKINKRPCHDASGSNINDVNVADSNEIDSTNEETQQPHFAVSKQVEQKIHVGPKFINIKNWLHHSVKMPIVAGLILSLLSLLSCYTSRAI